MTILGMKMSRSSGIRDFIIEIVISMIILLAAITILVSPQFAYVIAILLILVAIAGLVDALSNRR
jgi:uncharacterized membrane protein YdbT with pleckstrin-like domain